MTLYVVQARGTDDAALVRARFLAEGFSWGAFVFAPLWLLFHRLWLALVAWIALEVAFFFLVLPHVSGWVAAAVDILARVFLGLEATRLRQNEGARRATVVELVEARNRDEAEAIFYDRHRQRTAAASTIHDATTREATTREATTEQPAADDPSPGMPGIGT